MRKNEIEKFEPYSKNLKFTLFDKGYPLSWKNLKKFLIKGENRPAERQNFLSFLFKEKIKKYFLENFSFLYTENLTTRRRLKILISYLMRFSNAPQGIFLLNHGPKQSINFDFLFNENYKTYWAPKNLISYLMRIFNNCPISYYEGRGETGSSAGRPPANSLGWGEGRLNVQSGHR